MSTSEAESKKTLLVQTRDEAAEIFIINAHFHLVAHGLGTNANFALPAGVYTVVMRTGDQTVEKITALYPDETGPKLVEFTEECAFDSAAPIYGNSRSHEYHEQAAAEISQRTTATLGQGSSIFVMARDWSSPNGPQDAKIKPVENPAAGLTLRDLKGQPIFDFERQAENNFRDRRYQDPWAAARVEVDPGAYRLSLELPNKARIEMTVIAAKDWQTQVFLLQTDFLNPPKKIRRANLGSASIFVYRHSYPYQFGTPDKFLRTADLARQGLNKSRPVVNSDLFNMIISKWEDPFLGITGLHLLLREPTVDMNLAQEVVRNLRGLLGKHPDVEALAWKAGLGDPTYVFDAPPMVRAGWEMMLEASIQNPASVPVDSLAAQVANRLWGNGAWLNWQVSEKKDTSQGALTGDQSLMLGSMLDKPQTGEADGAVFFGIPAAEPEPEAGANSEAGAFFGIPAAEPEPEAPAPDAETINEMVRTLRIPASKVVEMIKNQR